MKSGIPLTPAQVAVATASTHGSVTPELAQGHTASHQEFQVAVSVTDLT